MFGDWDVRQGLAAQGLDLAGHYIGEAAANSRGINGEGVDYAQQLDAEAAIDLGRLASWAGTIGRITLSQREGGNTAVHTGSQLLYQEIYGQGQNFRLDEFTVEHVTADRELAWKLGFYPMGNDFSTMPYATNFTTPAICGHPLSLVYDSAWQDSPTGKWGAGLKLYPAEGLYLQGAAFVANPHGTGRTEGFKLDFDGATGAIFPLELGYAYGLPGGIGGTYKAGAYFDTSHAADVADPRREVHGRSGIYLEAAQQLFRIAGSERGLGLLLEYTRGDLDTARYTAYAEAALSYRGLVACRADDSLNLGWVEATINRRLREYQIQSGKPGQTNEQIAELNYTIQVTPSLVLRPGAQYDVRPGALEGRPSTWVADLHVQVAF
jgi:porin